MTDHLRLVKKLVASSLCLYLVGCGTTHEKTDLTNKAQDETKQFDKALFPEQADETKPLTYLTDLIQDTQLDQLIQTALQGNPSLQKTILSLEASAWNVRSVSGTRSPTATGSLSASKSKDDDTTYKAGVTVSWQLDLWAQLADSKNAAEKSLASNTATFRASQSSLVGGVMKETMHIRKAIIEACQSRLRAVFLTSVTTFSGLFPILGETSRQAQLLVPAAVSLAYGILFATVITLVLIPVLLMIQEDVKLLISRLRGFAPSDDEHSQSHNN